MSSKVGHLLDVNVLIARVFEHHAHHLAVRDWFRSGPEWAICPFTEAGFLRFATAPDRGNISVREAGAILEDLARHPGFSYISASSDWRTLTNPFFKRIHGHNQITDAFLLGLAMQEKLALVTLDRAMLHLAGEHAGYVRLLKI
jgi:hypothetical protein